MTVVLARPKLVLELEGHGRFQISQFHADWSRNEIPRATCVMAVGRRAADGTTAARIHSTLSQITKMVRAKVYMQTSGKWDQTQGWPSGPIKVFEGRLLGFGYKKIRGSVSLVAHFTHWLADLNFSSALSGSSHPNNPSSMTFSATVGSLLKTGVATGVPFGISQTAEAKSIQAPQIRSDLWARAIKPMLCAIANQKHVKIRGALASCFGLDTEVNTQALEALKRIEGPSGDDCDLPYSCYSPPLSLLIGEAVPVSVANAIGQAIRREAIDSFAHNTLWGKLVGYGSQFFFSVIPLVDRALVVPFIPGLRQTYCKVIKVSEYSHVDIVGAIPRPIRAVAVVAGREGKTGVATGSRGAPALIGIGGCYMPAGAEKDGMLYVVKPPAWLHNVPAADYSATRTAGIAARKGTSSSTTPVSINPSIRGTRSGVSREDAVRGAGALYNGYAHAYYMVENLRGRSGAISGKLRFDIAPGATVKVEGTRERFLLSRDKVGQSLVGSVIRVSIGIDAEGGTAGTAFQLDHLRTEKENGDDKTSILQHPLYTTEFLGAPLVDKLQFPNKDCCT